MVAFVLILFGVILIIVNIKAINKDKKSFGNVLEYKVENMSEVDEEIGQLRKDIAESLTDLQKEILELRNMINEIKDGDNHEVKILSKDIEEVDNNFEKLLNEKEDVVDNISKLGKTERIKELVKEGLNDNEICEKLSVGKGEVLLVRGLFK